MRVLLLGASGFIGKSLLKFLREQGLQVFTWSRQSSLSAQEQWRSYAPIDAVINLAGENIGSGFRWTSSKKEKILQSRLQVLQMMNEVLSMNNGGHKPASLRWLQISAIGYYGDPSTSFLADVCRKVESTAERLAHDHQLNMTILRLGLVLGPVRGEYAGGLMKEMAPFFRFGIGHRVGKGEQWMSWIHLHDLVRLFHHLLVNPLPVPPVINAVSAQAVKNKDFFATHSRFIIPLPATLLRLLLGEKSQLLLDGQLLSPTPVAGFLREFDNIRDALDDCVNTIADQK